MMKNDFAGAANSPVLHPVGVGLHDGIAVNTGVPLWFAAAPHQATMGGPHVGHLPPHQHGDHPPSPLPLGQPLPGGPAPPPQIHLLPPGAGLPLQPGGPGPFGHPAAFLAGAVPFAGPAPGLEHLAFWGGHPIPAVSMAALRAGAPLFPAHALPHHLGFPLVPPHVAHALVPPPHQLYELAGLPSPSVRGPVPMPPQPIGPFDVAPSLAVPRPLHVPSDLHTALGAPKEALAASILPVRGGLSPPAPPAMPQPRAAMPPLIEGDLSMQHCSAPPMVVHPLLHAAALGAPIHSSPARPASSRPPSAMGVPAPRAITPVPVSRLPGVSGVAPAGAAAPPGPSRTPPFADAGPPRALPPPQQGAAALVRAEKSMAQRTATPPFHGSPVAPGGSAQLQALPIAPRGNVSSAAAAAAAAASSSGSPSAPMAPPSVVSASGGNAHAALQFAAAVAAGVAKRAAPGTIAAYSADPAGHAQRLVDEEQQRMMDKKLQKRAANRKSAQLSRKRRKVFIEDLKGQNADLRRHHEILAVVPDSVFAFNATTGAVSFASNSAAAQFGLASREAETGSFFDLLSGDCSKKLRALITKALKCARSDSVLLDEVITICFVRPDKRLLGELSGRLARTGDDCTTCIVCVRPLGVLPPEGSGEAAVAGRNGSVPAIIGGKVPRRNGITGAASGKSSSSGSISSSSGGSSGGSSCSGSTRSVSGSSNGSSVNGAGSACGSATAAAPSKPAKMDHATAKPAGAVGATANAAVLISASSAFSSSSGSSTRSTGSSSLCAGSTSPPDEAASCSASSMCSSGDTQQEPYSDSLSSGGNDGDDETDSDDSDKRPASAAGTTGSGDGGSRSSSSNGGGGGSAMAVVAEAAAAVAAAEAAATRLSAVPPLAVAAGNAGSSLTAAAAAAAAAAKGGAASYSSRALPAGSGTASAQGLLLSARQTGAPGATPILGAVVVASAASAAATAALETSAGQQQQQRQSPTGSGPDGSCDMQT